MFFCGGRVGCFWQGKGRQRTGRVFFVLRDGRVFFCGGRVGWFFVEKGLNVFWQGKRRVFFVQRKGKVFFAEEG